MKFKDETKKFKKNNFFKDDAKNFEDKEQEEHFSNTTLIKSSYSLLYSISKNSISATLFKNKILSSIYIKNYF